MPDHRQKLAGNRRISSSTSTYLAPSRHDSGGDREFSFWCSSNTTSSENACGQLEERSEEDYGICSSPPLWETHKEKSCKFEQSPLLHCGSRHCHSVSPTSRSEAIAEGQRELMQMIQEIPESSFELSFQDMVDQRQVLQPVQNETFIDNAIKASSKEAVIRKQNKKKKKNSSKPNQIWRVESMDNETFLLKMFFPTSLTWLKKAKVGNVSKLSPTPSFQESIKQVGKGQSIGKSFQAGDNRRNVEERTRDSTNNSHNKSNKIRYVDGNFSFGCLPFYKKQRNRENAISNKDA